jgi:hypothetical protein
MHFESMLNGLAAERLGAGKVAWGGEVATIESHLMGLLQQDIAPALHAAHTLERPPLFDAAAFLKKLAPARRSRRAA